MGGRQLYVLGCGESSDSQLFPRQGSFHTMITETVSEGHSSSWLSNNPHPGSLLIERLFLGTGFDDPPHPDCALSPWLCDREFKPMENIPVCLAGIIGCLAQSLDTTAASTLIHQLLLWKFSSPVHMGKRSCTVFTIPFQTILPYF